MWICEASDCTSQLGCDNVWPCIASLASLCGGIIARQLSVVSFTNCHIIQDGDL